MHTDQFSFIQVGSVSRDHRSLHLNHYLLLSTPQVTLIFRLLAPFIVLMLLSWISIVIFNFYLNLPDLHTNTCSYHCTQRNIEILHYMSSLSINLSPYSLPYVSLIFIIYIENTQQPTLLLKQLIHKTTPSLLLEMQGRRSTLLSQDGFIFWQYFL